jgi:3D (Asp-Asp-Asp) domain-containing protein
LKIKAIVFILLLTCITGTVTYAAYTDDALHYEDLLVKLAKEEKLEPPKMYTVAGGDNLYRIAVKNDITLDELMSWNDLANITIHPGDQLVVSGDEKPVEPVEDVPAKVVNTVDVTKNIEPTKETEPVAKATPTPAPSEAEQEITVSATAYTAYCEGCSGTTAYGIDLRSNPDQKVIAVDPSVIPLGTKVWVEGYGEAIAGDTGGAIKGHKIDLFMPSYDNAIAWGRQTVKLKILN